MADREKIWVCCPQWTYLRPDTWVCESLRDGDVELGLVGIFGQSTSSWKIGNLHQHSDYLGALGELKDLEFTLPTHQKTRRYYATWENSPEKSLCNVILFIMLCVVNLWSKF